MFISILLLALAVERILCANILCVFPTPAYSHQSVFSAYIDKLSWAGHNVTVITPMPRAVDHVHQVVSSLSVHYFNNLIKNSTMIKKRGVVADETTVTKENYMGLINLVAHEIKSPNVTRLLRNKGNKFDLIVCEAYVSYILVFGAIYDAPVIQFSSGYAIPENFETVGGEVARNHIKHPNIWRSDFSKSNFEQLMTENYLKNEWALLEKEQENMLKRDFGYHHDMCQLKSRVLMLFINVPAVFDNNRDVSNNIQYLGGIHLKKPRTVRDSRLLSFMEKHHIIVYASFGSGIDVLNMDANLIAEFVRVFNSIPYAVLWKVDSSIHLKHNISSNVHTQSWFPQRDVLNHPHIKVFITQGGVQSTDEAVNSGVPMIGIPIMGDQFYNVRRYTELGIGEKVNILRLEEEGLDRKIKNLVHNKSYELNIKRLNLFISDTPVKPLRKALWFTNYVLRNKDAIDKFK
ncbi:ecdysteroid UDP-glucosyltransferase [Lacanobia oleracea granulovirus]|uniref:Ecdysteroid UDP-glucosyltransferase n=1 Tax=Lacanobia oleracea granulosis virus TaxID=52412 RepID=UDPE_GVLO|nr:ecdysteroid UDP-glucosyltransferase [Lacanobia oleracea granulovirus]Q98166.1 RecName: Full=Ecdysteroid UDP-glucosyltransferase; Flags: Precursor [Lacanobia oleracea granulovirus]CAA69602.1 ecdysteroid UDP-glucosyltransferase [Lacanobia oleracea granulovirus]